MKIHCLPFAFLSIISLQFSCNSKPLTPEEVVEKVAIAMSSGNCEDAMDFCDKNTQQLIQASIDSGCMPYKLEIDSITCKIDGDEAGCYCYQKIEGMEIRAPYMLKKIDNEWKVSDYFKDALLGTKFE